MKALILNCSLKTSDQASSNDALSKVVSDELEKYDVTTELVRLADYTIKPGVKSDMGNGDQWPEIRQKIINSEILIIASPTWVGRMSSLAQRALERMDAMLSETDSAGRPIAYNHVAGCIATGNEDGAKHVIGEVQAGLLEIGFTVPGQAWTYFNHGAGMGPDYPDTGNQDAIDRAHNNASTAAHNLASVAQALHNKPIPSQ